MVYLIQNGTSLEEQILNVRERLLRHKAKPVKSGDVVIIQNVDQNIIDMVNLSGSDICSHGKYHIAYGREIYFIKAEIQRQLVAGIRIELQTPHIIKSLF